MLRFQVRTRCDGNGARLGLLETAHGTVATPAFMPVGTSASVKTLAAEEVEGLGYELVLANAYHLWQRPGHERIQRLGGLHRFMGWNRAILTDSGGFQVMSLSKLRRVETEGVRFRSHLDGSEHLLTPELAMEIQGALGVDVAMVLDVCPAYPCSREEAHEAMTITHEWARRCLERREDVRAVFGIVQGGVHLDLRTESAEVVASMGFEGVAIGGVSVGEPSEMQHPVVAHTAPLLPSDRPRYLMGVGHPNDVLDAVESGIDLCDCVLPTRMARHHCLYTLQGRVNVSAERWAEHDGPVDSESVFPTTARYSAAYLRHLFKAREPLGARLATLHNLAFYARLMAEIREAIATNAWGALRRRYAQA